MTKKFWTKCFKILDFSAFATVVMTFLLTQQVNYANLSLIAYLSANLFQRSRHERNLTQCQNTLDNLKQNATSLIDQNSQRIEQLDNVILSLPEQTINQMTANQSFTSLNQTVQRLTGRIYSLEIELPSINDTLIKLDDNFTALLEGKANQQDFISLNERVNTCVDDLNLVNLSLNKLDDSKVSKIELSQYIANHPAFQQLNDRFTALLDSKASQQDVINLQDKVNSLVNNMELIQNSLNQLQQYCQELDNSKIGEFELRQNLSNLGKLIDQKVSYELIYGRSQSREMLIKALQEAKEQVILVCPWLNKSAINKEIRDLIRETLERGVNIEIGWGHLSDINDSSNNYSSSHDELNIIHLQSKIKQKIKKKNNSYDSYNAYSYLQQLSENGYTGQLTLKLLGTHEKYLICDHKYAMIGSHNFLSSGNRSQELEVGLKTTHIKIIEDLIGHFHSREDCTLVNRQRQISRSNQAYQTQNNSSLDKVTI